MGPDQTSEASQHSSIGKLQRRIADPKAGGRRGCHKHSRPNKGPKGSKASTRPNLQPRSSMPICSLGQPAARLYHSSLQLLPACQEEPTCVRIRLAAQLL